MNDPSSTNKGYLFGEGTSDTPSVSAYLNALQAYFVSSVSGDVGCQIDVNTAINGVQSVPSSDPISIYNINGQRVRHTNDIQSLPKGIYIVNGKKVVRR